MVKLNATSMIGPENILVCHPKQVNLSITTKKWQPKITTWFLMKCKADADESHLKFVMNVVELQKAVFFSKFYSNEQINS